MKLNNKEFRSLASALDYAYTQAELLVLGFGENSDNIIDMSKGKINHIWMHSDFIAGVSMRLEFTPTSIELFRWSDNGGWKKVEHDLSKYGLDA